MSARPDFKYCEPAQQDLGKVIPVKESSRRSAEEIAAECTPTPRNDFKGWKDRFVSVEKEVKFLRSNFPGELQGRDNGFKEGTDNSFAPPSEPDDNVPPHLTPEALHQKLEEVLGPVMVLAVDAEIERKFEEIMHHWEAEMSCRPSMSNAGAPSLRKEGGKHVSDPPVGHSIGHSHTLGHTLSEDVKKRKGSVHVTKSIDSTKSGTFSGAGSLDTSKSICATEFLCKRKGEDDVPILDSEANEMGAQDWMYGWNETMWDAMPFVGMGVMSFMDQVLVVFVALLNILIQSMFIGLVGLNMTDSPYESDEILDTLTDWRVIYAHNPSFADKFTSRSLGADVCAESDFLMQGATQAIMYSDITSYLQDFGGLAAGGVLAMLSISLWIMTCSKEMKRVALFFVGMWTRNDIEDERRPVHSYVEVQERSVIWLYGEAVQKNFQAYFTLRRTAVITVVVILPRLVILLALGIVGIKFLVTTPELNELVLNCVALECVLNVDDLLFHIFVPDSALRVVRKTKPLRIPKLHGALARIFPWSRVVLSIMVLVATYLAWLGPIVKTMRDVSRVMCDGDVDFLAAEVAFGGMVVGVPDTSGIQREGHPYRAIYQRTNLEQDKDKAPLFIEGGAGFTFQKVTELDQLKARTIVDWASLDISDRAIVACNDAYYENYKLIVPSALWSGVSSAVGKNALSCKDLAQFCFDISSAGQITRFICPISCGAATGISGQMAILPADGVTNTCDNWFAGSLVRQPCHDQPFSRLSNESDPLGQAWRNWEKTMIGIIGAPLMLMAEGNKTHFGILANTVKSGMMTQGCAYFKNPTRFTTLRKQTYVVDMCDVKEAQLYNRLSMRTFCPVTCGCHTSTKKAYEALGQTWNLRTGRESQCPPSCWFSAPMLTAVFGMPSHIAGYMQPPAAPTPPTR